MPYPTGIVLWWPHPWHQLVGCIVMVGAIAEQQILFYLLIGTTYGSGDGSTTFNVPAINDDRFIRGWGSSGGLDPGRTFGSSQNSDIGNHSHTSNSVCSTQSHGELQRNQISYNHQFVISQQHTHQHNANTGGANAPHKHGGNTPTNNNHTHPI